MLQSSMSHLAAKDSFQFDQSMEIPGSVRSLGYLAKIKVYTIEEINQLESS